MQIFLTGGTGFIEALSSAVAGTDHPLIVTSVTGIASVQPGATAREEDTPVSIDIHPRASTEEAATAAERPAAAL